MFLKGVWFIIAGILLLGHTPALAEPPLRVNKNGVIYYFFTNREPPRQPGLNAPRPPAHPPLPEGAALIRKPLQPNLPPAAEAQVNLWAAIRYPLRMLAKLGCYYPPAWPAEAGSLLGGDRHQEVPSIEEPQALVPEGWGNFRNYAQAQPAALGQALQSPGYLPESNPLPYSFPLAGPFSFRDTWGDRRSGGRHHRAVDIFAREGTEVYAITSGVIQTLATYPEAGITLLMLGQDGRGYGYMHLQGYAAGITKGKIVRPGEVIGYVGRTGIRQGAAHLHFQVYTDHRLGRDELLNPYGFLVRLCHGIGVEDLHHHGLARLVDPEINGYRIQVYRRPQVTALRTRGGQLHVKKSSVLVIKNF